MLAKQRFYRVLERNLDPERSAVAINRTYATSQDERELVLRDVPSEWVEPWRHLGIDLEHFEEPLLYWYDVEVLNQLLKYGPRTFADLDIWDIDWEHKRQLALDQGYGNLPEQSIHDPRTFEQKLHHAYLHRYIHTPPWRDWRTAAHPIWKLGQRLGMRAEHLERLTSLMFRPRR